MKKIHLLGFAAVAMLGAGCTTNTQTNTQTSVSGNGQTQAPATSDQATPSAQNQIEAQPSAATTINAGAMVSTTNQGQAPAQTGTAVNVQVTVKTYPITIKNFAFSQSTLRVTQGDKVVFTNQDSVQHSATSDNGSFDSGLIAQNASYTLDTSKLAPGTYTYHCSVHPMMKATLVVAAKAQ